MPIRSQMYPTADDARHAAEALLAGGTPPSDLQLLIGSPMRDVRFEPVGSFQGMIQPTDPVGTFAGPRRPRSEACGGWVGDRSRRRHGSFGDCEHDEVVRFERDRERSRVVDRHRLTRLLEPVTTDHRQAETFIHELHEGHAMLLIGTG